MTSLPPQVNAPTLQGRQLLFARAVWLTLVGGALIQWCISMPAFFALIQRPCTGTVCNLSGTLPAVGLAALRDAGISSQAYAIYMFVLFNVTIIVWLVVALAIFLRRAHDPGALLLAFLLAMANLTAIGGASGILALGHPVWAAVNAVESFLNGIIFVALFCLFPNGRFVPRWTRWVVVATIVQSALAAFLPPDSPVNSSDGPFGAVQAVYHLGVAVSIIYAQIYRYRKASTPRERQQTKWAVFGLVVAAVGVIGLNIAQALIDSPATQALINTLFPLVLLTIPVTIGIAILRAQLYDIDVIIRRTLVYGLLTAILAGIYFIGVVGTQTLLGGITGTAGEQQPLVIVATTLVIAAFFRPLRVRLQEFIDRRFYRTKYSAEKTLATFGATLRSEVDLDHLSGHLVDVVEETMHPVRISLWLRVSEEHHA